MVARITETSAAEHAKEDSSNRTKSEAGAVVSQGRTLLPPEMLTTGEYSLYETRPLLWPLLIRPALVTIVGIIITVVAPQLQLEFIRAIAGQIPLALIRSIIGWSGIVLSLGGLLGILSRYLRWRYTVYTVTNRRMLHQTGIIGKSYVDCSLSRVQNVYTDVTILGKIFGFGTIRVATAGIAGIEIRWKDVKEPLKVNRELNEAIQQSMRESRRADEGEL